MNYTRNPYTGTSADTIAAINLNGMSSRIKSTKWYWWVLVALSIPLFISSIVIALIDMEESSISENNIWFMNEAIQAMLNNPKLENLSPEDQVIANNVINILSSGFNLNFSNIGVYNSFVENVQASGTNKALLDSLYLELNKIGNSDVSILDQPIGYLYLKFHIQEVFQYKCTIWNIIRVSTLVIPSAAIILSLVLRICGNKSGAINNIMAGMYAYEGYLRGKDYNKKPNFIFTKNFMYLIGISFALISNILYLISGVLTYTKHQVDIINSNGISITILLGLIFGIIGLFFPILYSKVVVINGNYKQTIDELKFHALLEAINTVNRKYATFVFMKKAISEGKKVETPNELRQRLGLEKLEDDSSKIYEAYNKYQEFLKQKETNQVETEIIQETDLKDCKKQNNNSNKSKKTTKGKK